MIKREKPVDHGFTQHRAAAKAHYRNARRHPASIGKPTNQRTNGRDIPESQSATADYPVTEVNQPQLATNDSEPTDDKPSAPATCGYDTNLARPHCLKPAPAYRRRQTEKNNRNSKDPHHTFQRPIVCSAGYHADSFYQGRIKKAPRVDRADT